MAVKTATRPRKDQSRRSGSAPSSKGKLVKLDIGGLFKRPGWTLIDRVVGKEAYPLKDYADGSVDEIRASHVLEHFSHKVVQDVLNEWVRVLKPGGVLRVAVPDFAWCVDRYVKQEPANIGGYILGGHDNENDKHGSLYDEPGLRLLMTRAGLFGIGPWTSHRSDCASYPCSLNLQGVKPGSLFDDKGKFTKKVFCIMSLPRSMPTVTADCVLKMCAKYGMDYTRVTGAYWHHCLDRAVTDYVLPRTDTDWIVTVDCDSVFTTDLFLRLAVIFNENPQADALGTLQCGREGMGMLLNKQGCTLSELDDQCTPCDTMHFGLTLFRVSSLRKLRRPWFKDVPAPDGTFGPGRRDPDMWFWDNFKASGLKAYVAPRVPIGHLEEVITWPGEDLQPVAQRIKDWTEFGIPKDARR